MVFIDQSAFSVVSKAATGDSCVTEIFTGRRLLKLKNDPGNLKGIVAYCSKPWVLSTA